MSLVFSLNHYEEAWTYGGSFLKPEIDSYVNLLLKKLPLAK